MIAAFLAFTIALLATLPATRSWLREKRETAAKGHVFSYRRFLTPEERKRRIACLANLANEAVVWNPEIGMVLTETTANWMSGGCPVLGLPYFERTEMRWASPDSFGMATTGREDFQLHLLIDACTHMRFRALLIDPDDTPGLDYLCRDLDRAIARLPWNSLQQGVLQWA